MTELARLECVANQWQTDWTNVNHARRDALDELRGLVLAILENDHLDEHVARIRAKLNGIEGFEVDTEEERK